MKFDNVCVEHFVEVTHTFRQGDKIGTRSVSKEDVPAYSAYAKAHKPEIMEYLLKKEKAGRRGRTEGAGTAGEDRGDRGPERAGGSERSSAELPRGVQPGH